MHSFNATKYDVIFMSQRRNLFRFSYVTAGTRKCVFVKSHWDVTYDAFFTSLNNVAMRRCVLRIFSLFFITSQIRHVFVGSFPFLLFRGVWNGPCKLRKMFHLSLRDWSSFGSSLQHWHVTVTTSGSRCSMGYYQMKRRQVKENTGSWPGYDCKRSVYKATADFSQS